MVVIEDGVVLDSRPSNSLHSQAQFLFRLAQFRECQTQYEAARRWYYAIIPEPSTVHTQRDKVFWQCMRKNNNNDNDASTTMADFK